MLAFFICNKVKSMKFEELKEMVTLDGISGVAEKFPVYKFPLVTQNIKKKLKKRKNHLSNNFMMNESLNLVKFLYKNYKHDKHPQVMILDYHYKGKANEKVPSDHILGLNVNSYKNKK